MIALKLPALRPQHALGALIVGFAALAAWPWIVPPNPSLRAGAAPQAAAPPTLVAALPPLANFATIVERPLFAPSRRPDANARPAPVTVSADSRYRLTGILGTGAKRRAFIADGARRFEVAEGDTVDGATVKEIRADRVVLSGPTGEVTLKLSRGAPDPAATKPQ